MDKFLDWVLIEYTGRARVDVTRQDRLIYVSNQRMSNQLLCKRFGFEGDESKAATVSQVIGSTKDSGLIKADESETSSTRYARYLPIWA
jgi:ATP-dependent DNA helicase RecG